jgi:hypothetical protein
VGLGHGAIFEPTVKRNVNGWQREAAPSLENDVFDSMLYARRSAVSTRLKSTIPVRWLLVRMDPASTGSDEPLSALFYPPHFSGIQLARLLLGFGTTSSEGQ